MSPSALHETLLRLFRNRPTLVAELLRDHLGLELDFETLRFASTDFSTPPTEYRADQVVVLERAGRATLAIVLEAQLGRDLEKRFSWPQYLTALRASLRCPVLLVVVTVDPGVARWAAEPIDIGPAGMVLVPLVVGPSVVPHVVDPSVARAAPELAVLSALAHHDAQDGLAIAKVAILAADGLDEEKSSLYADVILGAFSGAARQTLEAMMAGDYQYQSDFAKKYFGQGIQQGRQQGRQEGRQEALTETLLRVLASRNLTPTAAQHARVEACADPEQLLGWILRATTAKATEDVFG